MLIDCNHFKNWCFGDFLRRIMVAFANRIVNK